MAKPILINCPELQCVYSIRRNRNMTDSGTHRHSFWELILFEEGEGVHIINGIEYPFRQGSIALLSPTDVHGWKNKDNTLHNCTKVKFSHSIWHDHLKNACQLNLFPVTTTLCGEDYRKAQCLLELLYDEHNKPDQPDNAAFPLNLIVSLLLLIQRNLPAPVNTDDGKTRMILLYIQEHFSEPINIADVANALNYSPKYFSRLFVNALGIPFHEYIKDLRLNYAYHWIKYSLLPVSEICYHSGFISPSHFSRSFRQKYGFSPSALRKQFEITDT